jgi:hypothetical protein
MDPCGVTYTSPGVPDYSTGTRHIKSIRMGDVISPPAGLGTPESGATWDLLIMTTPYTDLPLLHWKKQSIASWPDTHTGAGILSFVSRFFTDTGAELDAVNPRMNDGSKLASYWTFPDNLIDEGSGEKPANTLHESYDAIRLVSRGLTTELIGPMLFKGGRVYSGQVMPSTRNPLDAPTVPISFLSSTTAVSTDITANSATYGYKKRIGWTLPQLGPDALIEGDPLYRERDAEEGDYNVTRVWKATGVCDMVSTAERGRVVVTDDITEVDYAYAMLAYTGSDTNGSPSSADWETAFSAIPAVGANISLVYYTGLNASQSVRFKVKTTIEGVPKLGGPYASLSKIAPEADPLAIQLVADITNTLPHSYPGSYNDLGGLLGVIGGILKSVGIPLLRGVGAAGIPVLSPVVQILSGIANSTFGTRL